MVAGLTQAARRAISRSSIVIVVAGTLCGCYYAQAVSGHLGLMSARQPIPDLLADADAGVELKTRLALVLRAREFAVRELALPDNGSYRSYVDTGRDFVTWNVIATREFSVEARTWCFPVAGCVPYRGYYSAQAAERYAARLRDEAHDVFVNGASAYSTLGWFDDPVLNTMLRWRDTRLVGTIFHELAHQQVWAEDDTTFNESFAMFVQQEGVRRWLEAHGDESERSGYAAGLRRQAEFAALLRDTRAQLAVLYSGALDAPAKRAAKRAAFEALRERYTALKAGWGGYDGYDSWFAAELNNARLALVATYNDRVADFARLFESVGRDFARFYARVSQLAALGAEERARRLGEAGRHAGTGGRSTGSPRSALSGAPPGAGSGTRSRASVERASAA